MEFGKYNLYIKNISFTTCFAVTAHKSEGVNLENDVLCISVREILQTLF